MRKYSTLLPLTDEHLVGIFEEFSRITPYLYDKESTMQELVTIIQQAMGSGICTIAIFLPEENELEHVVYAGFNDDHFQLKKGWRFIFKESDHKEIFDQNIIHLRKVIEKHNLLDDDKGLLQPEIIQKLGLQSLLSSPIISEKGLIGFLNFFCTSNSPFLPQIKDILEIYSIYISTIIEYSNNYQNFQKLRNLNEFIREMVEVQDVDELLYLILSASAKIINTQRGSISQINPNNGELDIKFLLGPTPKKNSLQDSFDIFTHLNPLNIKDITNYVLENQVLKIWEDTHSILEIPIYLSDKKVRIGFNILRATKPIGILHFESPIIAEFSSDDVKILTYLSNFAGVLLDRLELDAKQNQLLNIQRSIFDKKDISSIIEVIMQEIKETLGYDYVNISLIRSERIYSEYVIGIASENILEFKGLANYSLKSNDIHVNIVRTRTIEVPSSDDPRFDPLLLRRFDHSQLVRVFIPMVAPTDNHIIGTVEAGYKRSKHRNNIYEEDVQILNTIVDYTARAFEQHQHLMLEKIGHEFRSSVVGIQNNASLMQRRYSEMGQEKIVNICDDIMVDCQILFSRILQFEHILGKPLPRPNIEKIHIFSEIILKTIKQLQPIVISMGFNTSKINYFINEMTSLTPIWADKSRLTQVFYNLFMNSIKYAENDPKEFSIVIDFEENLESWIIKIQDWGIGIPQEYEDKIFDEGFRTPDAERRNVTGSGLGLSIARQSMRYIGGDLKLTRFYKPTEFQVIIPKKLAQKPEEMSNDTSSR